MSFLGKPTEGLPGISGVDILVPLLQGAQVAVTGTSVKGVTLDASFRFRYASVTKG